MAHIGAVQSLDTHYLHSERVVNFSFYVGIGYSRGRVLENVAKYEEAYDESSDNTHSLFLVISKAKPARVNKPVSLLFGRHAFKHRMPIAYIFLLAMLRPSSESKSRWQKCSAPLSRTFIAPFHLKCLQSQTPNRCTPQHTSVRITSSPWAKDSTDLFPGTHPHNPANKHSGQI